MKKMRNNPSLAIALTLHALVAVTLFSACSSSDGEGGEKKDSSKTAAAGTRGFQRDFEFVVRQAASRGTFV